LSELLDIGSSVATPSLSNSDSALKQRANEERKKLTSVSMMLESSIKRLEMRIDHMSDLLPPVCALCVCACVCVICAV
jgi:predicted transcriptional regulator